jgi:hypothetical protein
VERRRQAWVVAHQGDKVQQQRSLPNDHTEAEQRAEAWRAMPGNQPCRKEEEVDDGVEECGCSFDVFDEDSLHVAMNTTSINSSTSTITSSTTRTNSRSSSTNSEAVGLPKAKKQWG